MIRVLVTGAYNIGKAGVATIVYKWGQAFPKMEVVYDYLMQRGLPETKYQEAIKRKGGKIYTCSNGVKNLLSVVRWAEEIMRDNGYEVLHINADSAYLAAAYIYAAKRAGVKNVYVHSHCTNIDDNNRLKRYAKTMLHMICRPYVCQNTRLYLACSKLAGIWMFGKNNVNGSHYITIYNGVEIDKYLFSEENRKKYRERLGIDGQFVLANIGRFSYQKNQEYLIEIFSLFIQSNPDSVLVLVGEGELEGALRQKASELGVDKKVIFLGRRNDVPKLLNAFDVLVMPSRFEGLPVTMVEAQMADLPCVVSANITREAKIIDGVKYVDLGETSKWVEAIKSMQGYYRTSEKRKKVMSSFNIDRAAWELSEVLKGCRN